MQVSYHCRASVPKSGLPIVSPLSAVSGCSLCSCIDAFVQDAAAHAGPTVYSSHSDVSVYRLH